MILPKDKSSKTSIVFYVLHLPVLILLFAVFGLTTFVSSRVASNKLVGGIEDISESGDVLSSGSGKDDDGDSDDDASEDDDNDEDSGSDNDGDDNDEDDESDDASEEKDNEDEGDDDDDNSGSSNSSENSGSSDKTKSEMTVTNSDGTFSVIKTEEKDGEIKKEIKTFDTSGNKIRVEKFRNDDGKEESRVAVYDGAGNKVSDIRLKTEDGKELELRIKEGETELSRVKFDIDKQELLIRSANTDSVFGTGSDNDEEQKFDENSLKIRLVGNDFVLTRKGVDAFSNFPLIVDDASGTVLVQTPVGDVSLGIMPDTIVEKAEASDDLDEVVEVALESGEVPLEFKMTGTKSENLLGVFNLQIPSTVIYDAQTGEFLRSEQPFVARVLDLFSF